MTQRSGKSVFVSSTSQDLRSYRQTVKDALIDFGIFPKVQEHFPPDYRKLTEFLEEEIRQCDAVVCLVGRMFGTGPQNQDQKVLRSYSQIEYDLACRAKRPTYVFFPSDNCKLDEAPEEDEQRKALQHAHRSALIAAHKCDEFSSDKELYRLIAKMIPRLELSPLIEQLKDYLDGLKDDPEFAVWNQQRYFELQLGGKIGNFNIHMLPKHLPGASGADFKGRYEVQEVIEKFGQLVVIGEPGSGKTTALKHLALNYAKSFRDEIEKDQFTTTAPLPVYIWLPNFNLMQGDTPYDRLVALVRDAFQRHEAFNSRDVNTLLQSFRVALLLDGHNEMGDKNIKEFQEGLKQYARTHERHYLLITSRTYDFEFGAYELPVFELRELRYPEDFGDYIHCYLQDREARQLMAILESNLRARQLAGNPLLLRMIILVFQFEGVVPNSRGMLFERIANGLLSRWDFDAELEQHRIYWFQDKHILLNQLGYAMKEEGLELSTDRTEEIFKETLQGNSDWFSISNPARPHHYYPLDVHINWQTFVDEVKGDHLLFQRSDRTAVRFWHQTMQEYFAACRIWDEICPLFEEQPATHQSNYTARKKLRRKLSQYIEDRRWHEILAVVAGLIRPELVVKFIDTIWHKDKMLAAMCLSNVELFDSADRLDAYLKHFRSRIQVWGITVPRLYPWALLACLFSLMWLIPQERTTLLLNSVKDKLGLFDVTAQVTGMILAVTLGALVSLFFFRLCASGIQRFDAITNKTVIQNGILALRYIRNIDQDKAESLLAEFEGKIVNDFSIGDLTRNTIETGLFLPQRDESELILMLRHEETRLQALEGLAERGRREGMIAIANLITQRALDNLTYGTAVKAITRIAKSLPLEDRARQKLETDLKKVLASGDSRDKRVSAYWGLIELGVTDVTPPPHSKLRWILIGLLGLVILTSLLMFYSPWFYQPEVPSLKEHGSSHNSSF